MIVISDTTPIISLLKIDRLDLLEKLFSEVQIPRNVFLELTDNPRFQTEANIIRSSDFIKIVDEVDESYVTLLCRLTGIDFAEGVAIYLCDARKADLLLMDESLGREVAIKMGIRLMGTIGILLLAYQELLISKEEIKKAIMILKGSKRHISQRLYQQLQDLIES